MKSKISLLLMLAPALALSGFRLAAQSTASATSARPKGSCDIYGAAGDPCVAAHSTTRALYASYNGPLYQVLRQSDGKTLDIGVVQPRGADAGGYADAARQDAFCANTYCWLTTIYDQSGKHNDLTQAPRGAFSGPAMGGFNNLPIADMAPITIMGHKAYGAFIEPGMGIREDDPKGVAVDDQAEGQYWVVNGKHFNNGCCFDYGNAEIDSHDDDAGTMETTYFGDATPWYHGNPPGPWVMTDQENNLVGCVVPGSTSKLCPSLPNITWRFVTAMAKGEPHHWTSLGGNSQEGPLQVMFDGPRVDSGYDPMRKQGAILLGNGGDNSVGSQGTFYEGAVTAANTFPTDATDQQVQANIASAHYDVERLSITPASQTATPPGLQTFTPGSSQETTVTFTNTTGTPISGLKLNLNMPSRQWTAVLSGSNETTKTFADAVAPEATVSATFKVTSGPAAFNGDLVANATFTSASGAKLTDSMAEKVRNVSPVKINEFSSNSKNGFIELYNSGPGSVDLSNWTLSEHAAQQPILSTVKVPAGTRLASRGFYLLGLSNSGLSVPASAGELTLHVRSTAGISAGDTVIIDAGSAAETHKIASVGTPANSATTLWEPLPDGPIMTIPAGATNVPVTSAAGFTVGQKIAIGYGAVYPAVARGMETYEVATVTAVGKEGTQALLGADAPAGATNIKVTSVANISVGDKIRLDVDSVGHGIEEVTVSHIGTQAVRSGFTADAAAGDTSIKVRGTNGLAVGDKLIVGTPANRETVTITSLGAAGPVGPAGPTGATVVFTPALARNHPRTDQLMAPGTGVDIAAPLRFTHAANLPFADRGTGISFEPATSHPHLSNEPVQALGTGITLDSALTRAHSTDAPVYDAAVKTAGYQGNPSPNQWFGGPELSASAGNMVLRDAAGLVVDSLNYGLQVDPWAAEGYQGASGPEQGGCHVSVPRAAGGNPRQVSAVTVPFTSQGRYPDGADTVSNCNDFMSQSAASLVASATTGGNNIKVSSVDGFQAGQKVMLGAGAEQETLVIANVGTPGATTIDTSTSAGATTIPVASPFGFRPGQTIAIDTGSNAETAVVATGGRRGTPAITLSAPLKLAHAAGTQVAGTGITFTSPLTQPHPTGSSISDHVPTPGAPNQYSAKRP